jgi:transcriptional regulator with GAF, ATPase, and Fis domain
MHPEPSPAYTLDQMVIRMGRLIDSTRDILIRNNFTLPAQILDDFSRLKASFTQISQQISLMEKRREDLLALMDIGQVINSSLDPEELLQVVMDTMVRLLHAERGFLMLRNTTDELTTRVARNWERESVHPSEYAVSRTVVDRVIAEGTRCSPPMPAKTPVSEGRRVW